MPQPNAWEYLVIPVPINLEKLEKLLNLRGRYNWELCNTLENIHMIFKRPTFNPKI